MASLPIRVEAVAVALPPVHAGEAMTTRNEPSEFGVKVTCTLVELTTDAVTFGPPAVIAAIAPKVCPELPVWELSTQVWARLPIAPDAAAVGLRPLHRFSVGGLLGARVGPGDVDDQLVLAGRDPRLHASCRRRTRSSTPL